jgi:hypothetical protein
MTPIEIEAARIAGQLRLDAERSAAERNRLGQFATPPRLAERIVRAAAAYLRPDERIDFLDPTIGSGAFYSALLRSVPRERIASAEGVELDPRFVALARSLWDGCGLEVTEGDFTALDPGALRARPNLLVANPPYVRHHHLDRAAKQRLQQRVRETLGLEVSGLAGLYVHMLLLSHAWMAEGGVAAWLVPSEWMDVNYGSVVRTFLTEHVTPLRIHLFEAADVRFDDALVSSSVVFFRKAHPTHEARVLLTAGEELAAPRREASVALRELRAVGKWSPIVRGLQAPRRTSGSAATLGDLFRIRRGLATGRNDFFIRPRTEWEALGIPDEVLRPILPASRSLAEPIIEAEADGYPRLARVLALLDIRLSESEVQARFPALWSYLESEAGQAAREGYLARSRKRWYAQEAREPAMFVCTYMGRGRGGASPFRLFLNRSRAVATNVFLMLYPQGALAARLAADPAVQEVVLRLLTEIAAGGFQQHGRVYGGGLHKLEPKELAALPAAPILEALELAAEPPTGR